MRHSIADFTAKLVQTSMTSDEYCRPSRKFLTTLLCGMIGSKSTVMTEISKEVSTPETFKATYKRLTRNINNYDLTSAYNALQQQNFSKITDHHIVALDMGDLIKPQSNFLEGLAKVGDGSDGHKIKNGYWLVGAVGININSEDKTPIPLELKLHSSASEACYSENTLLLNFFDQMWKSTQNKGIVVIDRGGDRSILLQRLFELEMKFIISLKNRHLIDTSNNSTIKVGKDIISRNSLPYKASIARKTINGKRAQYNIKYDFKAVKVKAMKKVEHKTWMVTVWADKHKKPMFLITTKPVYTSDDALKIITGYLSRWSIEETYRYLKCSQSLEKVKLQSMGALNNMVSATFMIATIIANVCVIPSWVRACVTRVYRQKTPPKTLYNYLYRALDYCSELMKRTRKRLLQTTSPRDKSLVGVIQL